jgi:hypothetical protein
MERIKRKERKERKPKNKRIKEKIKNKMDTYK